MMGTEEFQHDSPRQQQHNLHETYQFPSVQLITPDDGHRRCPKHVEFRDKIKFWILDASSWLIIQRPAATLPCMNFSTPPPSPRLGLTGFGVSKKVYEFVNQTWIVICPLLGYYAASSGNFLPTFRDDVSIPFSGVKKSPKTWFQGGGGTKFPSRISSVLLMLL